MPPVLIIHLKRFQYERGIYMLGHIRSKIEELVDFPLEGLDLSPYAMGPQATPPIYDLFAVSDHSGGLGGGHYTAHAQNFVNKKWYYFNDSSVSECHSASVVQASAYVLFYKLRAPELGGGGAAMDVIAESSSELPHASAAGPSRRASSTDEIMVTEDSPGVVRI